MARIFIDGEAFEIEGEIARNMLEVGLSLGFDIPYFCWHPALGSVGACRQCAVKQFRDESDTRGQLVMSCMTPATDGTRISIIDPEVRVFRAEVIEWLMVNHPHDCPVCDEGGECHLQDMTVMTGHTYRRYRFKKRTHMNQDLGPFVTHEMNRCITCYRCTRFYRDYAGGHDLNAFASKNHVYFGRHESGVLENEFSGNLVEVCPTGVFTDKTLKHHYTRKWDLQTAPSVCPHCGVGCNILPGERYGTVRRILNRYNGQVNGYFLCDRGRFGYEFMNSEQRIRQPLYRNELLSPNEALKRLAALFRERPGRVIGIGSPRASLESNHALRELVSAENFFRGIPAVEARLLDKVVEILQQGAARTPSLKEVEEADVVLVLGEDIPNTAPRVALALRQSVRHKAWEWADRVGVPRWQDSSVRDLCPDEKSPLFIVTPRKTRIDDIAAATFHAAPADIARFGFAVAAKLGAPAPRPNEQGNESDVLATTVAEALRAAKRPLIIGGVSLGSNALVEATANVAWALCESGVKADLMYVVPESNSLGLTLMGGRDLDDAFDTLEQGRADIALILENDLYRRAEKERVDAALEKATVVVFDYLHHETSKKATFVLPSAGFAEDDGTLVNSEGRAQRFFQVYVPEQPIADSRHWLCDLMRELEIQPGGDWENLDDVTRACATAHPALKKIVDAAPSGDFRIIRQRVPRQTQRFSGRTAMFSNVTVHEPPPPEDIDAPLTFSMEGHRGEVPPALLPLYWAPGWNSHQAVNKFQSEVGGALCGGDPGVRLIEPEGKKTGAYFRTLPQGFRVPSGQWLLIPLYEVFGSDELSNVAPAIVSRIPAPRLVLNRDDADTLGVEEGETVAIRVENRRFHLPAMFDATLARGLAGYPVGLPGLPVLALPALVTLTRARDE